MLECFTLPHPVIPHHFIIINNNHVLAVLYIRICAERRILVQKTTVTHHTYRLMNCFQVPAGPFGCWDSYVQGATYRVPLRCYAPTCRGYSICVGLEHVRFIDCQRANTITIKMYHTVYRCTCCHRIFIRHDDIEVLICAWRTAHSGSSILHGVTVTYSSGV